MTPPVTTHLTEWQRLPTSGARAVEPFTLDGRAYLAIPQLAYDAPGSPGGMNGGDSNTDLLLLRRGGGAGDGYEVHQRIPAPGGEDAEFFRIGGRAFLAVAGVRSGAGPYDHAIDSAIHEWDGERFVPFQAVSTFAGKQWRHVEIDGRHFLALAQGVALPHTADDNRPSVIFEWNGERFEPFQEIPSRWAYNWLPLRLGGEHYLAHADHVEESRLYRWDGERFVPHQTLVDRCGRAFATFTADGVTYLVCAVIEGDSRVLRWEGGRFAPHQVLEGPGGRELAVVPRADALYVVRVNFISGGRQAPNPALLSQVYAWRDGRLEVVEEFPTLGATDVAVFGEDGETLVAVSSGLNAAVGFTTETVIYSFA